MMFFCRCRFTRCCKVYNFLRRKEQHSDILSRRFGKKRTSTTANCFRASKKKCQNIGKEFWFDAATLTICSRTLRDLILRLQLMKLRCPLILISNII